MGYSASRNDRGMGCILHGDLIGLRTIGTGKETGASGVWLSGACRLRKIIYGTISRPNFELKIFPLLIINHRLKGR